MIFRAVIFDLDGTLLDTLEDLAEAMNRVLARMGFATHPVEAYKWMVGDGVENLVMRALPPGVLSSDLVKIAKKEMLEEYSRVWFKRTKPYPGIPDVLEFLETKSIPKAILSNKVQDFTSRMVSLLLSRWNFFPIIGQREGIPLKPDPTGALEISVVLGIEPQRFVFLGDTETDIRTALAAGMYPVGVCWGFRSEQALREAGAREVLREPMEIARLFS